MQAAGNISKLQQDFNVTDVRRRCSYILTIFIIIIIIIIITVPVASLSPLYTLEKKHIPLTQSNGVQELGL
jgi:hypothetical protein